MNIDFSVLSFSSNPSGKIESDFFELHNDENPHDENSPGVVFASPFKRPLSNNTSGNTRSKKRLNLDTTEQRVDEVSLDILYKFRFSTVSIFQRVIPQINNFDPREVECRKQIHQEECVRAQVEEIEYVLGRIEDEILKNACRTRVQSLLLNRHFEYKMSELGMILFYLDTKNTLPNDDSLVDCRGVSIQSEVESYIKNHRDNRMPAGIPSGKTNYILRAFAHMVFTSNQGYNRGGLYAIVKLLNNPKCKISMYLQPEHRVHILNVIHEILEEKLFDGLFASYIAVHPSLEEAIRIELKLPPDVKIHSTHVFYACLMSLFADIRQFGTPNCYAVGALIYATENHTFITLKTLIDNLTNGTFKISHMEIPIAPILSNRLDDLKELEETNELNPRVTVESVPKTIVFDHLFRIFNLDMSEFNQVRRLSLNELIDSTLQENMAVDQASCVRKYFSSYTSRGSPLLNMQLAVIETLFINRESLREEIIELLASSIENAIPNKKSTPYGWTFPLDFREAFKENLRSIFLLENCNEKNIRVERGVLYFGNRKLNKFKGDVGALCNLIKSSIKLCTLTQDAKGEWVLTRINGISELTTILNDVLYKTENQFKGKVDSAFLDSTYLATRSRVFKKLIAKFCSNQIRKPTSITDAHLYESDLLLLPQIGGLEDVSLKLAYGIEVDTTVIKNFHTPYEFLSKLITWIGKHNPNCLRSANKVLIATKCSHTWTLTPSCWSLLLGHRNDFQGFMNEIVYGPARLRLHAEVPVEVINSVINRFSSREGDRQDMRNYFKGCKLTFESFKSHLLEKVSRSQLAFMEEIIEDEFMKVRLSKRDLSKILIKLKVNIADEDLQKVFNVVSDSRLLPFALAEKLRVALNEFGVSIIDPYLIELNICEVKNFPMSINMGDSNWASSTVEDFSHENIIFRYSFVNLEGRFFLRSGERELLESNGDYNYFYLSYPME